MEKNIQNNINDILKKISDGLSTRGIEEIKELFGTSETLKEKLEVNPEKEYIKKMLISQMDLGGMLLTHKYSNDGFSRISEFREESDKIKEKTQSDSILKFDEDTIESLFGNSLDIKSEEECEIFKEILYSNEYKGKSITSLYAEEKFKNEYENEKNAIKKFIKSFKYKKNFKQDSLEDSYMKKIRELIRKEIIENPGETAGYIITESRNKFEQGIAEYEGEKEVKTISNITLNSLQQSSKGPISIEEECEKTRKELNESNPTKFETEYRKMQVTLGSDRGTGAGPVIETIPFEEIPDAMRDLQQRYENAYNTSQSEEEYIKEVSKIYADYIYIQPYEDGNKRTATCLLNSMLLSKGILPPPISIANGDEELGKAFSKAHDKDYTMLQDIMISGCEKIKSLIVSNSDSEIFESKSNDNIEKEEVEI